MKYVSAWVAEQTDESTSFRLNEATLFCLDEALEVNRKKYVQIAITTATRQEEVFVPYLRQN